MTTTQTARGWLLKGTHREVQNALCRYFDQGYTIVPGSASNYNSDNGRSYVEIELRPDWVHRLNVRDDWMRMRGIFRRAA